MSSKSLPTIAIDCRPPVAVQIAASLACLAGALALWLILPRSAALLTAAPGAIVLWLAFARSGWFGGPRAIRRASLASDGTWWLEDGRGQTSCAQLLADSRVFTHWLWLSWDSPAGRRQALLPRQSPQSAAMRCLAVRLRLIGIAPDPSPDGLRL